MVKRGRQGNIKGEEGREEKYEVGGKKREREEGDGIKSGDGKKYENKSW